MVLEPLYLIPCLDVQGEPTGAVLDCGYTAGEPVLLRATECAPCVCQWCEGPTPRYWQAEFAGIELCPDIELLAGQLNGSFLLACGPQGAVCDWLHYEAAVLHNRNTGETATMWARFAIGGDLSYALIQRQESPWVPNAFAAEWWYVRDCTKVYTGLSQNSSCREGIWATGGTVTITPILE